MTYGPIDMVVLEFENIKLTGKILPELLELAAKKIVRVMDLVVIQKYEDGKYEALEIEQLDEDLLSVFDPLDIEISGIVQVEDIDAIAAEMEDDTSVAILLFENLWAVRFKEAVLEADGRLLHQERIPYDVVEETLEIFALEEGA